MSNHSVTPGRMISTSGSGLGQLIISLAIATAARDNSLSFCFSDYIGGCTLLDLQKSNQLRSLLRSEKFTHFLANVREFPFSRLYDLYKSLSRAREVSTGCSVKIVFFQNSLQPLPRLHRSKRPSMFSTQCECTVTPIGW